MGGPKTRTDWYKVMQ